MATVRTLQSIAQLRDAISLDVIFAVQEHRTSDCLERCGLRGGARLPSSAERSSAACGYARARPERAEAPAAAPAVRHHPPVIADHPAGPGGFPADRIGRRAAGLREDHAALAVGRAP